MRFGTRFRINDALTAGFASFGDDHLCIVFFRDGRRVGSVAIEHPSRMGYMSEATGHEEFISSLTEAIARAEAE